MEPATLVAGVRTVNTSEAGAERALHELYEASYARLVGLVGAAIVLRHLGLDIEQIARELGVPAGTVKSRLSRARAALAPLLREDVNDRV
jgi:RNA polymerase sigma-70 factor (ECF subfamily)